MRLSYIISILISLAATAASLKNGEPLEQDKLTSDVTARISPPHHPNAPNRPKWHSSLHSRQANLTTEVFIIECNKMLPVTSPRAERIKLCHGLTVGLAKKRVLVDDFSAIEECNASYPDTTLAFRVDVCGGVKGGVEIIYDEECNAGLRRDTLLEVRITQCCYVRMRPKGPEEESVVRREGGEMDENLNGGASWMEPR
jgi:hypothetical protein